MSTDSIKEIEQEIHKMLLEKTTQISYNAWLKELKLIDIKEKQIFFSIYSDYKKSIIESNYMSPLKATVREIARADLDVIIFIDNEKDFE